VRIDKWLWAARFYKTRSLAAQAVDGGKIALNAQRPKPAKDVKIGDVLEVRSGAFVHHIAVLALSDKRGPAAEAAKLYEETEASRVARQELAAQLRASAALNPFVKGRPTKKARRDLERFQQPDEE
jgi:ribosome-associated heat shock protein Hsp15